MDVKQILAKAAQPKESEMVTVWRFMNGAGDSYWAKKIKNENDITFPLQSKLVIKGSPEDK